MYSATSRPLADGMGQQSRLDGVADGEDPGGMRRLPAAVDVHHAAVGQPVARHIGEVGALADGDDHRIGFDAAGHPWYAPLLHRLCSVKTGQMDLAAECFDVVDLVLVGGRTLDVDGGHLLRPHGIGAEAHVHAGVAGADYHDPLADGWASRRC